jgi:DNA-binding MarR family transcriptional regulator
MKQKEILVEVIEHLFTFDAEHQGEQSYTFADFVGYLNAKEGKPKVDLREIGGKEEPAITQVHENLQNEIGIFITLMFRYAKMYIKKALTESVLQTVDEFSFLINLMSYESLTKTELINKQVLEKTSGTEVIKRLLNLNLIREFADTKDKRSVRVAITDVGRQEIITLLPKTQIVSQIVVGNLSVNEVQTLAYLLKKLDFHHHDIFMNQRNASLEELAKGKI